MIPALLCNFSHVHDFGTFVVQQSRGTFLFKGPWFFGMDFLLISDPMNVHYVLSKNFSNYPKGPEFREIFEPLGDGIFNSDSESWSIQRRIFHSLLVKNKRFDLAVEITLKQKILNGLFPLLENVSQVDIQDVFQRFTFDNICQLVLGFDPNSLSIEFPQIAYQKAFDVIEEREQVGQSRKDQMEGEAFDLLTYFLVEDNDLAKVAAESGILTKSNKFLRDMAFNLLVAGRDTIGAGLVWLFWLVGTHPFVEQKILEEIKANLGAKTTEKWRVFSIEEGRKLVYLHAVICEVLRLMEEIWGKDCLEFKPERWISEGGRIKHVPSYKFVAFNAGPRSCIAGRDTIGAGLVWLFWVVGTHAFVEKKILEEIKANLRAKAGEKWRVFCIEEVGKLVYLHAVICEVLRLYPPLPFEHKVSIEKDIFPSGHNVPRNMRILLSFYSMGRMEEIWGKDCLEFKPRVVDFRGRKNQTCGLFQVHSIQCRTQELYGKDLSFLQMKTDAASVIWNYSLQVVENHPVSQSVSVILYMKKGLKVRVLKRFAT
ncbi:hypothetical protein GH714_022696 [Hevea brasiliensis]|uniref:Cytochrome P450 n=1 Tax=Hevea brasiliensis TaxID=3981 RepID=A0A6A6MZ89_HEVBR|nr:hypothetical protein GH714_022696 [Hevea brasiliensis]